MVYLDFRSLSLIIAMRRASRRLIQHRYRFTLTVTQGACLAAIVAALGGGGEFSIGDDTILSSRTALGPTQL